MEFDVENSEFQCFQRLRLLNVGVRYALEHTDLSEAETPAVRSAFEVHLREGEADASEIKDSVYPDHDAGYDTAAG